MTTGPTITIRRSCFSCEHCESTSYRCQGDSGSDVYCAYSTPRKVIGDTTWETPDWCPILEQNLNKYLREKLDIAKAKCEPLPEAPPKMSTTEFVGRIFFGIVGAFSTGILVGQWFPDLGDIGFWGFSLVYCLLLWWRVRNDG